MTRRMQELARRYVRYVVAIAACVVALVFQWLIWPYIPPSPQLLFYPAVLVAAWFGGLAPGVLAVVMSSLAIAYWFLPPDTAFSQGDDLLDMAVFVAMGLTVAALMARTRASTSIARSAWKEAEAARVRLSQAYLAREELLAIVSHDLRTPLTSIELCSAQIMRSTFPSSNDQTRMAGERIQRATRRMEVLVQNLLDAATIDAGALRLELGVVQVDALLESTVQLCQPIAERKSVRLEAELSGRTSLVCDGDRIRQTLENLVGNALKFVPQDGEVTLSVRTEKDQVVFEVRDTGPGIPPEQIGHVFDRYWRGSGGASSGLGLYIAKAIVEGHGGKIWVTSGEGRKGTTFAFTLPLGGAQRVAPLVALRSA